MADIAIVYASVHHGNTKKLLEKAAQMLEIDLYDAAQDCPLDLSYYKAVGFASGIYMSAFHKSLDAYLAQNPFLPPKTFLAYTSGSGGKKYAAKFEAALREKGLQVLGTFQCKGYDTFGPWKLIGGIAKGRPSKQDADDLIDFMREQVLHFL